MERKIYIDYKYEVEKNELVTQAYEKCKAWLKIANEKGIAEAGELNLQWR